MQAKPTTMTFATTKKDRDCCAKGQQWTSTAGDATKLVEELKKFDSFKEKICEMGGSIKVTVDEG